MAIELLPQGYFWEFKLEGDPVCSLLPKDAGDNSLLVISQFRGEPCMFDGHRNYLSPDSECLLARAQQQMGALYDYSDPRIVGIVGEDMKEAEWGLVVHPSTARVTVMPMAEAKETVGRANPSPLWRVLAK